MSRSQPSPAQRTATEQPVPAQQTLPVSAPVLAAQQRMRESKVQQTCPSCPGRRIDHLMSSSEPSLAQRTAMEQLLARLVPLAQRTRPVR